MAENKKIAVIGVGNILLRDEGLGVRALDRLRARKVPENVTLHDAGTSLPLVLGSFHGFDKIIIVDAVRARGEPGAIYRFTLEELEAGQGRERRPMISLHELDVPQALALEKAVSRLPDEIVFLGMEPENLEPGLELTRPVLRKMEDLISAIEREFGY